MKQVTFTIHDGKVEIKAEGFVGGACEAATKAFEEVLGGNITDKKRTADYYRREEVRINAGAK
jgi:hypothetical protein